MLRGLPAAHPIGCRANRPNRVASEIENAKDYLEIGVKEGFTLSSVNLRNKSGVVPHLMFNRHLAWGIDLYEVTSDEFFSGLPDDLR